MKEIQEWNPYYIGASCSLYRPEQFYPWLYPYGSSRHYISLWNDPEQMEDVEDKKRIMEMYPLMARRLQPYVEECCDRLAVLRARLNALAAGQGAALPLALDGPAREPMKLTLDAAALGLTGQALADHLRQSGMECEYADPRYLVLMFTPENPAEDFARLEAALAELCARGIPPVEPPAEHREAFCALARQAEPRLTVRQAVFAPQETIPAGAALGRVCALPTVSCPPAIPIVVSGEVIGPAALELFAAYGVETVSVVKPEKF